MGHVRARFGKDTDVVPRPVRPRTGRHDDGVAQDHIRPEKADVFNAATLGGAKALGREDLGRIAPGAKADLLLWRGDSIFMTPLRDPIRNIVYSASAEDLDTVIIDGEVRMRGREIPGIDVAVLTHDLQAAGERMWANVNRGDWASRTVDELAPQTFAAFNP